MKIFKVVSSEATIAEGTNPKPKEIFFKNERDAKFFIDGAKHADPRGHSKILKLEEVEVIE